MVETGKDQDIGRAFRERVSGMQGKSGALRSFCVRWVNEAKPIAVFCGDDFTGLQIMEQHFPFRLSGY